MKSPSTDTPERQAAEIPLPLVDQVAACCPRLTDAPISQEDAKAAARLFKALADPVRVRLLSLIGSAGEGEACVCDLVDTFDLAQPTVSHHLRVLLDAGLVERERRGSWAFYRLRAGALDMAARVLAGGVE